MAVPKRILTPKVIFSPEDFRANPATGTAANPAEINNGLLVPEVGDTCIDVGEYCQVTFDKKSYISEHRHYGNDSHNGDGELKVQYWDGSSWVDHITGIPTRGGNWSEWEEFPRIYTDKVRIVSVVTDSGVTENSPMEWEMRGYALRSKRILTPKR